MNRREFIKKSLVVAVGAAAGPALLTAREEPALIEGYIGRIDGFRFIPNTTAGYRRISGYEPFPESGMQMLMSARREIKPPYDVKPIVDHFARLLAEA